MSQGDFSKCSLLVVRLVFQSEEWMRRSFGICGKSVENYFSRVVYSHVLLRV